MKPLILSLILAISTATQTADVSLPSAKELLERTIAYHDPEDVWSTKTIEFMVQVNFAERLGRERGYSTRKDRVLVDSLAERFRYRTLRGADRVEVIVRGDSFRALLNHSEEISAEDRNKHRLNKDQLPGMRDYYTYVFGMPMKLLDPGTKLDPEIKRVEFAGRQVYALRVTYAPEVGRDVWYFYVDPETYALVGCRFYHDESANDGEYMVFQREIEAPGGLRLPKKRLWYMNRDEEYLASDEVTSIGTGPSLADGN